MKTLKISVFILLICSLQCCDSQKGYDDLDELYADFVKNIKNSNVENLKDYCHKVAPDQGTLDYMKKNNFSYRGLPEDFEERKITASLLGDKYYESINLFRERLIQGKHLDNLKYIGREHDGEKLYNKDLNIYFAETFILIQSNKDTLKCKLGEMFKINGKWKSFTHPKFRLVKSH